MGGGVVEKLDDDEAGDGSEMKKWVGESKRGND